MQRSHPNALPALDWFDAGEAAFCAGTINQQLLPPLDDPVAQRQWLGGFAAAWAACPEGRGGWCDEALDVVLMRALADRGPLYRRLLAHGLPAARVLH